MLFLRSFRHAFRGLKAAWHDGINFKIQILIGLVTVSAAYRLEFNYIEWAVVLSMIGIVLFAELINTALERTLDMLEPNHHPLVGKIKDITAGSVLLISLVAATIGVLLFAQHL